MTDLEIVRYLGVRTGNMNPDSSYFTIDDYTLDSKYMNSNGRININKLRRDINKGRVKDIVCTFADLSNWTDASDEDKKCWNKSSKTYVSEDGTFGPNHIIPVRIRRFLYGRIFTTN